MKCVKKYSEGGAFPPGRGRRSRGGGVDYNSGGGRGRRLSRECKEAAEQKRGQKVERPSSGPCPQPKAKRPKLNVVPLQPPKTGIPKLTKEQEERSWQLRHANPRFL